MITKWIGVMANSIIVGLLSAKAGFGLEHPMFWLAVLLDVTAIVLMTRPEPPEFPEG